MRNFLLVVFSIFFTSVFFEWDKLVVIPNAVLINYFLSIALVTDYFLGTTERFYSNSLIEAVFRSIGRLIFYMFNLEEKGYKMDKKTKR